MSFFLLVVYWILHDLIQHFGLLVYCSSKVISKFKGSGSEACAQLFAAE